MAIEKGLCCKSANYARFFSIGLLICVYEPLLGQIIPINYPSNSIQSYARVVFDGITTCAGGDPLVDYKQNRLGQTDLYAHSSTSAATDVSATATVKVFDSTRILQIAEGGIAIDSNTLCQYRVHGDLTAANSMDWLALSNPFPAPVKVDFVFSRKVLGFRVFPLRQEVLVLRTNPATGLNTPHLVYDWCSRLGPQANDQRCANPYEFYPRREVTDVESRFSVEVPAQETMRVQVTVGSEIFDVWPHRRIPIGPPHQAHPYGGAIIFPRLEVDSKVEIQSLPRGVTCVSSSRVFPGCDGPSETTVEIFDPVPTFAFGSSIVSNPATLISGGRKIDGVVADGTVLALLRITGPTPGEELRVSLPARQSNRGDLDGALRLHDSGEELREVRVKVQNTSPPMAFVVYRAPADFSDGILSTTVKERSLNIRVERLSRGTYLDAPIKVVRPPVVLVHGLWGSAFDWIGVKLFNITFSNVNPMLDLYPFNYENTNSDGFGVNAQALALRLGSWRAQFAKDKKVAIAKFDFVAHSMGGNIVRTLNRAKTANSWNYRSGYIHKLITIGTPHLGSPLARELMKAENVCVANMLSSIGYGVKSGGAVGDLAGNGDGSGLSSALQELQQAPTAPTAMIAGQVAPSQFTGLSDLARDSIDWWCKNHPAPLVSLLTPQKYGAILGTQHDGIVPVRSALNKQYGEVWGDGLSQGPVHSEGTKWLGFRGATLLDDNSNVSIKLAQLLNTPISSWEFVK